MDTYEKKYKEALEWARKVMQGKVGFVLDDVLEKFPELKESEDERIRKWLIRTLKSLNNSPVQIDGAYEMMLPAIAWLEKQGEQKLVNEVKPKFRHGDRVRNKKSGLEQTLGSCIVDVYEGAFPFRIEDQDDWELVEQKPAWSDEDEAIYYGVIETEQYMLDVVNGIKKFNVGNISIKEECTKELNWLKSLKDRVQPQQEWGEEDLSMIGRIRSIIEKYAFSQSAVDVNGELCEKEFIDADNWLKSLRPQNTWKPSEGQLECLGYAIEKAEKDWSPLTSNRIYLTLKALKEQLLELMGSKA